MKINFTPTYQSPELELISIACEQGFAASVQDVQEGSDPFEGIIF